MVREVSIWGFEHGLWRFRTVVGLSDSYKINFELFRALWGFDSVLFWGAGKADNSWTKSCNSFLKENSPLIDKIGCFDDGMQPQIKDCK